MFKGEPQLKFIIQWIAASAFGRRMVYCSFGDARITTKVFQVHQKFKGKTVNELLAVIQRYQYNRNLDLFDYLAR